MGSLRRTAWLTLLPAVCLGASIPVSAATNVWRNTGPGGGFVSDVVVDPTNPATLYAVGPAVFRSTDHGTSWTRLFGGFPWAGVLVIDPNNPATLYLGTAANYGRANGGVWKSTDAGATWHQINRGITTSHFPPAASALAIDPNEPTTLYSAAQPENSLSSVFKSVDGGTSWQDASRGLEAVFAAGGGVGSFVIDPASPTTLYAASFRAGVFKSTDGGENWGPANTGLDVDVTAIAIDQRELNLYAGTSRGRMFKSTNGAVTWQPIDEGLPASWVEAVVVDPLTPSTIYAALRDGVFKSTDRGQSWKAAAEGTPGSLLTSLTIDPTNPRRLYVGTTEDGVFATTDAAATWHAANIGMRDPSVTALVLLPTQPTTLYASAQRGVFKSVDGAGHWRLVNDGLFGEDDRGSYVTSLAAAAPPSAIVYASRHYGRVFRSDDGGALWYEISPGATSVSELPLAIDPRDPQVVYAAAGSEVFKTSDGGRSWTSTTLGSYDIAGLALHPARSATIYAAAFSTGVYRTTTAGASWEPVNNGLTDDDGLVVDVRSVAIDPEQPRRVYAGTAYHGVFRSDDEGGTWHAVGLADSELIVTALVVTAEAIYAGTFSDGVLKSTDGGSHWIRLGELGGATAIAVEPTVRGRVFAATGIGVFVIDESSIGCLGDADTNGVVTVDEVLLAVNILLDRQPLTDSPSLDADGSASVEVSEVVRVVRNALLGC